MDSVSVDLRVVVSRSQENSEYVAFLGYYLAAHWALIDGGDRLKQEWIAPVRDWLGLLDVRES